MGGVYVVFGHHPCPVSIPTFLHLASLTGFWHSTTPTSVFIFNVFITLYMSPGREEGGSYILRSTSKIRWDHPFLAEGGHVQWSILDLSLGGRSRSKRYGYHITST